MITCVFGRTGSGKTVFLRRALAPCGRLLVHDPMGEHLETCQLSETRTRTLDLVESGKWWRISHIPTRVGDMEFCANVAAAQGNCTLAFDETAWETSANKIAEDLKRVVACHRHYGLDIYAAAQRPSLIPRLLTGNARRIVVFALDEKRDLDYLREHCGPEVESAVRRLEEFQAVDWKPGNKWGLLTRNGERA